MIDSNQTLRFPRSSREAYGYTIELDHTWHPDKVVGFACSFIAGFLLAMTLFL